MNGLYAGAEIRNCLRILREKALVREMVRLGEWAWNANGDTNDLFGQIRVLSARMDEGIGRRENPLVFESADEATDGFDQT